MTICRKRISSSELRGSGSSRPRIRRRWLQPRAGDLRLGELAAGGELGVLELRGGGGIAASSRPGSQDE